MSRAAFSILLLAAVAGAQDLVPKAAPQKGPIAVTNCTLHPIDGPTLQNAWILFDKGRIVKLGTGDGAFDNGVEIHDAKGRHVYPGFIAPYTSLGLVEINAVRASVDMREVGELKPEARAAVAVNPDSTLIPVTRSNGVLTFMTFPRGGAIPGRASVMSTDGWTWEDMAIRADAGLVVNWTNAAAPPAARGAGLEAPRTHSRGVRRREGVCRCQGGRTRHADRRALGGDATGIGRRSARVLHRRRLRADRFGARFRGQCPGSRRE